MRTEREWKGGGGGGGGANRQLLDKQWYTVEPLNKGHFGANSFVPRREVVPISEVK